MRWTGPLALLILPLLWVLLLLPQHAAAQDAQGAQDTEREIRTAFERFKNAIISRKGAASAELLSGESLRYYEQLRQSAMRASPAALAELPPGEQLSVLWMRRNISAIRLNSYSARELFDALVEGGALGGTAAQAIGIGRIRHDAHSASAEYLQNGRPLPSMSHFFRHEPDGWKIDIPPQARMLNQQLAAELERREATIEQLFEESIGQALSQTDWEVLKTPVQDRLPR